MFPRLEFSAELDLLHTRRLTPTQQRRRQQQEFHSLWTRSLRDTSILKEKGVSQTREFASAASQMMKKPRPLCDDGCDSLRTFGLGPVLQHCDKVQLGLRVSEGKRVLYTLRTVHGGGNINKKDKRLLIKLWSVGFT
ncbi:hypothetical protein F2P81_011074 [Scophthalmus maximus]|uniref:Uncharacterized protein n=1 Tax=Scophthalmus maximus TaxID=52904 RepID=A0A6A4T0J4_SCOMX|nr:hypothetical protein F2P81_011074 [Scophthalmus maximus]